MVDLLILSGLLFHRNLYSSVFDAEFLPAINMTSQPVNCQERCHRWYLQLVSWVPPETFQFVNFTSNDNKDGGYMCFRYKKYVK